MIKSLGQPGKCLSTACATQNRPEPSRVALPRVLQGRRDGAAQPPGIVLKETLADRAGPRFCRTQAGIVSPIRNKIVNNGWQWPGGIDAANGSCGRDYVCQAPASF